MENKDVNQLGIFFGSDTGNTEKVANIIKKTLGYHCPAEVNDIAKSKPEDLDKFPLLLLGIPTWYYGEAQCDWDDFFPTLTQIDWSNKYVGIFGCGDQVDYSEYFCDAMGTLRDIIQPQGAKIVGQWSTRGYIFDSSKSLVNNQYFIGLAIDEDRQPELTNDRVERWLIQVCGEIPSSLSFL
ncbi:MAG: flavodoxin FldA [Candidatus Dasytiphilus stammeri]